MLNIISTHITPRVCNIPSIIIDPGKCVVATVIGVAASALSTITFGTKKNINEAADIMIWSSCILPIAFKNLLSVINPKYQIQDDLKDDLEGDLKDCLYGVISEELTGEIPNRIFESINKDDSFSSKHVVSRISFALYGVSSIVTRAVEFPFGLLAALGAIFTCGKYERINTFAIKNLAVFGVIGDISFAARGVVNPHQYI